MLLIFFLLCVHMPGIKFTKKGALNSDIEVKQLLETVMKSKKGNIVSFKKESLDTISVLFLVLKR